MDNEEMLQARLDRLAAWKAVEDLAEGPGPLDTVEVGRMVQRAMTLQELEKGHSPPKQTESEEDLAKLGNLYLGLMEAGLDPSRM